MTLEELHRHAAALQAGGGPLAALGADLAQIQDPAEAAAILERHRTPLEQQARRALSEDDLDQVVGGAVALNIGNAGAGVQAWLSEQNAAVAQLLAAMGQEQSGHPRVSV